MPSPDPKALAKARALLSHGQLDAAVRLFVEAGSPEEAARALGAANRFVEAANVLLATLPRGPHELASVREPHLRARASQAANLLRQAGMAGPAEDIERELARGGFRPGAALEDEATVRARGIQRPADDDEKTEIEHRGAPLVAASKPVGRASTGPAMKPLTRPPSNPPATKSTRSGIQELTDGGFHEGAVIDDRYELGALLGRGGMARVFAAYDRELGQQVAIKVFDRMDDPTLLARFKQELLSSRQIAHANVVRLFDIGTYRDQKYLTLELLVGQDLKERLKQPIAVTESLDLLAQACRGLAAAHAVGVIHRDIKPQNLFVCSNGVLKVMDFGIAKLQAAASLTEPGNGVGTPEYMAPEQIRDSSRVSPATDLYAIGITAYRMCTGRVPFADKEVITLLKRQLQEAPRPPREVNPRLPPQLEQLILELLAKDPEVRPHDAAEVAESFSALRKLFAPAS